MFRQALFITSLVAFQSPVYAQDSFSFDAVNGFVFIEIEQDGNDVRIEYLTAVDSNDIMCVILDANNQPIEIQRDIRNDGRFDFEDAEMPSKDRIFCQADD